jgi:hypothetical protein
LLDGTKRSLVIKPKYAAQYNEKIIDTGKINVIVENNTMANADDVPVVNGLLLEFNDGKNIEIIS